MQLTLYHGTSEASASVFLADGWQPSSGTAGANQGDPRYLYLTNIPENALWFAEEGGGDVVLEIKIDTAALIVDPEDGIGETVEQEIEITERNGLPALLAAKHAIPADAFTRLDPAYKMAL
jgi:hypothetical protein